MEQNYIGTIYLAGGCFWGLEKLMSGVPGVLDCTSGYANGTTENPTYEEVCRGNTGHRECVRVRYAKNEVSLASLLYVFFNTIDTSVRNRQGNDFGTQYQAGVYYAGEDAEIVHRVVESVKARGGRFMTEIESLRCFYPAEEYHQKYLEKHPGGYCHVTVGEIQKASRLKIDAEPYRRPENLKERLSQEAWYITQEQGTEAPFSHPYDKNFDAGIYVDIATGEPLFSSKDKYDCGCGWPAFSKPIDDNVLVETTDRSHGMFRTEVKSRVGASHLGHVFDGEGLTPTNRRFCIDGGALEFIPKDQMEERGYGWLKDEV